MTIYICGDSTAASYTPQEAPITGWGQLLPDFLPSIPVENRAMGGRSTKSFLSEGRLQKIEAEIQPGDLLLIQFTHNDTSDLVWRHTDPWTSFVNNLSIFVSTAQQNDARPVLMTPICRRYFRDGTLLPSHGDYPDAIRMLARKRNVPLIDLYEESRKLVQELGDEASRKLYDALTARGIEVLWDDRTVSAGVMFSDADLFGVPVRIVVSPKGLKNGTIEIASRDKSMKEIKPKDEVEDFVCAYVKDALAALDCTL